MIRFAFQDNHSNKWVEKKKNRTEQKPGGFWLLANLDLHRSYSAKLPMLH